MNNERLSDSLKFCLESSLRRRRTYYLYIIKCGIYYKIGYASNVRERFYNYNVHNPFECVLIGYSEYDDISHCKNVEKYIYSSFLSSHHKGEWYILSQEDLGYIKGLFFQDIKTL